ncbi:hypothetical protein K3148_10135 [Qipengyuania aurantiaca]|uniref:Uncharacterized protein n=1 Tax=Qipengyuania aurantiaca TaxID=2867233 RepID=A0ABX8ZKB8_9SPHN|nr:hypothetical protein [Qipengyuania aurantiaca]QZD89191.1 hypothetical protein K3148_10135 [Qipengyuania aurantiaca]
MFDLGYPEISPEAVALHSLEECKAHLENTGPRNLYIFSAACSAHRAVQSALTVALAGSANIGASPEKVRKQWLEYFERDFDERPRSTPGFRVMSLRQLAAEATTRPLPWSKHPLGMSAQEGFFLMRLASYRDDFEHPKQLTYLVTIREVARAIAAAVPLVSRSLEEVRHHTYELLPSASSIVRQIEQLCAQLAFEEEQRISRDQPI